MNSCFKLAILIVLIGFFSGCGSKVVKMNEFKDISYSYHPHTDDYLEAETEDIINDDEKIQDRVAALSKNIEKGINATITNINTNQDNVNIMQRSQKYNQQRNIEKNRLFNDRFDSLRLE